ncbi:hypothetical protein CMI37_33665 [Candidatus Pacearchaeota archaeon]|nr:hypothetical protein [Candidatus Pacearchaeota archaeon]
MSATAEDAKLAKKVKLESDEHSLKQLIEKHSCLCYNILQKFNSRLKSMGINTDDLFKEKDYLVYKAACTYNPEKKVKFSTWLGNYTRYYCLTLLSKKNAPIPVDEETSTFYLNKISESKHQELEATENVKEFISFLLDSLKDKRAKHIYMLRYFSDSGPKMTWKKIAKKVGVSSQTAINIHNRAKRILKNKIKSKEINDNV